MSKITTPEVDCVSENKIYTQMNYFNIIVWSIFFCYSVCMALIFQNIVVPNIPSLGGTGKLLAHDAVYFDSVAWELAKNIQTQGWHVWKLFPANGATGNVGILAALYAIWGHDPSLMIPINAGLHAFSGLFLFLLAIELANDKKVGRYAGIIAGLLFIIFPSALSWYGQIHKDSFAIAGTLLMLLVWIKIIHKPIDKIAWLWVFLGGSGAILLIGIVRPYGLTLLLFVSIGLIVLMFFTGLLSKNYKNTMKRLIPSLTIIALIFSGVIVVKEQSGQLHRTALLIAQQGDPHSQQKWQWQESAYIPDKIEHYIETAARTRRYMINYDLQVSAGSTMDAGTAPENITEVMAFLPKALLNSVLAPFPPEWFAHKSIIKLLVTGEMMIYYFSFLGLFFLIRFNRKLTVWVALYFALSFMLILGFTIPNLGTLYRYRFAYFSIILMLGILGWVIVAERKGLIQKLASFLKPISKVSIQESIQVNSSDKNRKRKQLVGLGIYVMGLTFIGFLGFFYRDILMAHVFGLSGDLDRFFIALLIPMAVVTIFSMPLGAAITPFFLKLNESMEKEQVQKVIAGISLISMTVLLFICAVLYLVVPHILPLIVQNSTSHDLTLIRHLISLALPILFFSAPIILGNALLNALGKVFITGVAQLIVPIIAILAVMLLGDKYGVQSVMIGMVIGQLLNLLIIQLKLRKTGYSLIPQKIGQYSQILPQLGSQYFPLVATAFFMSITILVSSFLAMTLPEGNVSIYNLGSKVVLLITGLLSAGVSTVILPYFSALVTKNHFVAVRRELSFLLLLLTFLSIPVSVVFFVLSEPIINFIFSGNKFEATDIDGIVRVMQYAVVRIPFFACNILLLKFATATRHVIAILIVAILGLLLNIGASLFLMQYMGVAGIALGVSISMVITTLLLLAILTRYGHIQLLDLTIILLNWLLFITLLMSVHFRSYSGSIATLLAYGMLLVSYLKSIIGEEKWQAPVVRLSTVDKDF